MIQLLLSGLIGPDVRPESISSTHDMLNQHNVKSVELRMPL